MPDAGRATLDEHGRHPGRSTPVDRARRTASAQADVAGDVVPLVGLDHVVASVDGDGELTVGVEAAARDRDVERRLLARGESRRVQFDEAQSMPNFGSTQNSGDFSVPRILGC